MKDRSSQKFNNSSHQLVAVKPWHNYNLFLKEAGWEYGFHNHPYFQAIHVFDGQLDVDCGKGWQAITPSYVHVLPPGCSHRLKSAGHRQFGLNFTVKPDNMGLLDALRTAFPLPTIHPMCFHSAWLENLDTAILENVARLRMLNTLMDWTVGLIGSKLGNRNDPEANRLADLIEKWRRRSINVAGVAKAVNCSRPKAQRICNRRFGCGIAQLHRKMRIEEASRLLLNTGLNVGEIAEECGYADLRCFSRAFTRVVGVSPSAFRRKIKEG